MPQLLCENVTVAFTPWNVSFKSRAVWECHSGIHAMECVIHVTCCVRMSQWHSHHGMCHSRHVLCENVTVAFTIT